MSKPIRDRRLLLSFALALAGVLAVLTTLSLAQQGPEIRVTHSASRADQPDVAVDSNGNVHIAYCDNYGTSSREIWYTMLDNDGNTLIDDTRITADDGEDSTRPAVVVDSSDSVHIMWRDQRWDGGSHQEVTYTKLDPYLDDMDGSAAISSTITLVDDTRMSYMNGWYMYGIRMAVDSNDDIHAVWDFDDGDDIYYMKIDASGNDLISATVVVTDVSQWRALPDLALDSNDDVHVAWADRDSTSSDEVYYMMLDGSDGSALIDRTRLTPDDDEYSKWTAIVVDADDKVHVVWQDDSGSDKEIYYTKLDPSLDDMDGSPAISSTITLIDDTPLTPDDGLKSRHPVLATDGRLILVTWEEDDNDNIHYALLSKSGDVIFDSTPLTTNGTAYPSTQWTLPYTDVDANSRAHITWCDSRDGAYEVYYTYLDLILGYVDGHVYDAFTMAPLEGVTVTVGFPAVTDASGYYTMTTYTGVYTATAEHPWYTTAYSVGLEIITGTLTTADFYLVPRGRLYGYVTDYDRGTPLEATVVVSGWDSLVSDPITGYYEIYVDAGSYDLQATANGYITGTASSVAILPGADTQQDFSLVYAVAFAPDPLHVTLDWQTSASAPATITNRLPISYPFDFFENPGGFVPVRQVQSIDVPWFGQDPVTGTVLADDTLGASMLFSATYAAGVDQPGDYTATLLLDGAPPLEVPVTMTVLPPADMGKLEGYVTDHCLGDPVEASVHITDGVPITTTAAYPDGYYTAWLAEGAYDLAFSAEGYLTQTASVNVVNGETTVLDVDLVPARSCIVVEPDSFEVWLITGTLVYTHPLGLDITNVGGLSLTYEIVELDEGYTSTLSLAARSSARPSPRMGAASSDDVRAFAHTPTSPSQICASGVLLIQDSLAWGYDAMTTILNDNGIPYDLINSSQIATTDFSPYKMVLIPSVQGSAYNQAFNDNLARFEDFIDAGGLVLMSFCTQSGHTPYIQPPFGSTNNHETDGNNYVEDPAHPIFSGVPNPYTGNSASHNYLTDLLPGDRVLVTRGTATGGDVVMIERDHRAGMLVAGGQTFEWGWANAQGAGIILENMIPYYYNLDLGRDAPWLWEDPISGTVPSDYGRLADTNVDVMFTALYTDWVTPMPLGTYSATLFVLNNDSVAGWQDVPVVMHVVEQFITPTASFESDSPVCLGNVMVFTDTTTPGVPTETTYEWDFGDEGTAALPGPTHLYAVAGSYTVTLTACNTAPTGPQCDVYTEVVEVQSLPTAGFSYSAVGLSVTFTNTSSSVPPGTLGLMTYLWDFGDGITGTLVHPSHTYAAGGDYDVTLWATGACGTDVFSDTVSVCAPVDITDVTETISACVVDFDPTYSGDAPITWAWQFENGTPASSAVENPMGIDFGLSGTYAYTATATNCGGAGMDVYASAVTVSCPVAPSYGVDLSAADNTLSGNPGDTITYSLVVENIGSVSDSFDVALSGNTWTTVAPSTIGPLAAGATGTLEVEVTIPTDAADGVTDAVAVTVTSQGDPGESDAETLTTTAVVTGYEIYLPLMLKLAGG